MKQALLIFAKNITPGKVKTRLAASVGNDVAIAIYQKLLAHTATVTNEVAVDKFVYYSEWIEVSDHWNLAYDKRIQAGADLGERMMQAFADAFYNGYHQVIIIGTDCYELNSQIIEDAFDKLLENDVVLGPALDGGYYLFGMKKHHAYLFKNIQWSTDIVLKQTIIRCVENGLSYTLLPVLSDIDEEADLAGIKELMADQPR